MCELFATNLTLKSELTKLNEREKKEIPMKTKISEGINFVTSSKKVPVKPGMLYLKKRRRERQSAEIQKKCPSSASINMISNKSY